MNRAYATAVVATMLGLVGCTSAKTTTDSHVHLTVGVEAASDEVTLIGTGYVCDHDLHIKASLDADERVITLAGKGPVPDNEFNYCARYIDTGGESVSETENRLTVTLEPGMYTLRAADGADRIEFDYHNGIVTSSDPYQTLSLQSERRPQRDATVAAANQLLALWNLPDDRSAKCDLDELLDTPTEQSFTSCSLSPPRFTTDVGGHPVPAVALAGIGCTRPSETDLGGRWELTCELDQGGDESTLHIRSSHNHTGRTGLTDGWLWSSSFSVWMS